MRVKDNNFERFMLAAAFSILLIVSCGPLQKEPSLVEKTIEEQRFCYLYVGEYAPYNTYESCHKDPIDCEDARHFADRAFNKRVVSSCFREPND